MQTLINKAFTIMEIMTVVVIVGVIATFAIPNFTKTMNNSYQQDTLTQLTTIHAAQQIYRAQNNGSYWPSSDMLNHNLAEINLNLGLSIMANGVTYLCNCTSLAGTPAVCSQYSCSGVRTGIFTALVTQAPLSATSPYNPSVSNP